VLDVDESCGEVHQVAQELGRRRVLQHQHVHVDGDLQDVLVVDEEWVQDYQVVGLDVFGLLWAVVAGLVGDLEGLEVGGGGKGAFGVWLLQKFLSQILHLYFVSGFVLEILGAPSEGPLVIVHIIIPEYEMPHKYSHQQHPNNGLIIGTLSQQYGKPQQPNIIEVEDGHLIDQQELESQNQGIVKPIPPDSKQKAIGAENSNVDEAIERVLLI
jgi:hypothetical protein